MQKKILMFLLIIFSMPCASYAFEDCIISADGKLTEIKLENNEIIDVYPIFTLMNEKNMLYVHPLKSGETGFSILKNGKDRYKFSVKVDAENTVIKGDECFDILTVDTPPEAYEYELDAPPMIKG